MKMEPNKIYKLEDEPNLLSALQSDLADILADSVKATKALRSVNDRAFDLMKKLIAINKSNDQTKEEADSTSKEFPKNKGKHDLEGEPPPLYRRYLPEQQNRFLSHFESRK